MLWQLSGVLSRDCHAAKRQELIRMSKDITEDAHFEQAIARF